jgi:quercetin dioxygenase-like cupin family protein
MHRTAFVAATRFGTACVGAVLAIHGANSQALIQRRALLQEEAPPGYQTILNILEIAPGSREIRHTHPGPLAGYILEGTLTLEHDGRATANYKSGEAFYVEAGKVHQGINSGNVPVKLIAVLIVEKGKPPSSPAP